MISHTQYEKCYSRNLCFFPEKWCICSCLLSSLQTEEDYIPYPSVHEVLLDHLCHLYFNYLQWLLCVYTFTFQWRCWVALLRFHSSFCPSSVATGLRGPIISLQSRQKLTSHLVLPPISNWRQTAQLKYTGSISWGRWEEMQNNLMQMPKKTKKQAKHLVAVQKERFYHRNYKCLLF